MSPSESPEFAQPVTLGGQPLWLLPESVAWHAPSRTLFVADLHLGKAATFRARGLPVPAGTTADNLQRLQQVSRRQGAETIVFLGDLLHSARAQQAAVIDPLRQWRAANAAVRCVLVRGNHDRHAGDPPRDVGFDIVDEPWPVPGAVGLAACHHPQAVAGSAVLAGHWHPVVTLTGPGRDRQRLACFCVVGPMLVLPSFGAFTGGSPLPPPPGSTSYPVGGGRVWTGQRMP